MTYRAPVDDILFAMTHAAGLKEGLESGLYPDLADGMAGTLLGEAARFAEDVLAPINRDGDIHGAKLANGVVTTAPGWKEAYGHWREGGWQGLVAAPEHGGMGLPHLVETACFDMWSAANMAFMLGPLLSFGAADAIATHGAQSLKDIWLGKLVAGEWTATMNLTEPQAGSDLNALRAKAERAENGTYRIFGQKIFITYGDHDMTDNIVHLVLARIDGAPAGTRGISLFLVPKRLINADGSLGAANDLRCLSIEHKMGIHASPTCVMAFGEKDGALGYLLGAPHSGLAHMFIMMNAARLSVGGQGLAQSEAALQQSLDWARNRRQGKLAGSTGADGPVPIIEHPDVKRMLLTMKASTEAMRALVYTAALSLDAAHREPDAGLRAAALARAELLTPIVKGWCTEAAIEVTSLGIQVHGGMGYIEETGVAQYFRDVRIAAIYEGTTGIQANDLIGRKLGRDQGAALIGIIHELCAGLADNDLQHPLCGPVTDQALKALTTLEDVTRGLLQLQTRAPAEALAVAVPYLHLCGVTLAGALMAQAAGVAVQALKRGSHEAAFYEAKLATANVYAMQVLPMAAGWARVVRGGGASVAGVAAAQI